MDRRQGLKRRRPWCTAAVAVGLTTSAAVGLAADEPIIRRGAESVGEAVVPYLFAGDLRSLPATQEWKPGNPVAEVPRVHAPPSPTRVGFERRSAAPVPDALVERQWRARRAEPLGFAVPILNVPGQGFMGHPAPDTVGDVGPGHFIQATNTSAGVSIVVYDKTGVVLAGPFQLDSLGSGECAFGEMDPTVLYDRLADRWLLAELSSGGNRFCVYISRTGDPVTGGWFNYDFQAVDFPDFGNYGVWVDAYYGSSNEHLPAVYAFDRSNMLDGAPARPTQRFTAPRLGGFIGFQALTPADHDGTTPPPTGAPGIFLRHNDDEAHEATPVAGEDFLELFFLSVDFDSAGESTFTGPFPIAIAEIDSTVCGLLSFNCFDQPGGGPDLAPLHQATFHRLQYTRRTGHETLIGGLVTDVGGDQGGLRWFELRRTTGDWSLFQEGTYSIDSADRWMGSIAQDRQGNIALGYNVVDETTGVFPGIRYTGRLVDDPGGTLPRGEHSIIEGTARNGTNRYGDYAAMSLDPSDDCTFWFTGEYNDASTWSTRVATFRFDNCDGPPPASPTIVRTGGSCPGTVTIAGSDFSPNQEIALVEAANLNGWVKIGSLCPGSLFEIGEPFNLPPNLEVTDGVGGFSTTIETTAGRCFLEAIDLAGTCRTSNAIDANP